VVENYSHFCIGQLVHHKLFDYRGVIIDVDSEFQGSAEWYELMALSKPPKNKPWYHVLVHDSIHSTYVAEQNLEPDLTGQAVHHPDLDDYFERCENGLYVPKAAKN
jgi:heat shock protein HspQ